jgi:hypothetical protein
MINKKFLSRVIYTTWLFFHIYDMSTRDIPWPPQGGMVAKADNLTLMCKSIV